MENVYHVPVLLSQTIDSLNIKENGLYLDGTAGGGGHSYAIATKLTSGHLYSIDQDPDAIKEVSKRLQNLPVTIIQSNFSEMDTVLKKQGDIKMDGILLDLGVSSHQLDDCSRGFSYHQEAPLDMRMSQSGQSAYDFINTLSAEELSQIFFEYGEEKFARNIAKAIVNYRNSEEIKTTTQLAEIVASAVPAAARRGKHPARKVFQALRIAVNRELDILPNAIETAFRCLKPGGRLSIITFHSLEDRIVKDKFNEFKTGCICPPQFPVCVCHRTPAAKLILKKPIIADEQELVLNPRSRSAKLRCVEKIHELY